jgi:hypothetical protein
VGEAIRLFLRSKGFEVFFMTLEELNERYKKSGFFSKIRGVTMKPERQENLKELQQAQKLFYEFELNNPADQNAIKLFADETKVKELGYISKELAPDLRRFKDYGVDFEVRVAQVQGGTPSKPTIGCNILIILKRDKIG